MYAVSDSYKEQIARTLRNPTHVRVRFGVVDPQAQDNALISANSNAPYSTPSTIKFNDSKVLVRYDTLEHNQFLLDDGAHLLGTATYQDYQGYVSGSISTVNCTFTTNPKLTVTYASGYYELSGLTFTFDEIRGEYCPELVVKVFKDNVLQQTIYAFPNTPQYVITDAIVEHNKIEVEFLKTTLPYKRLKLGSLAFGVTEIYQDDRVVNVNFKRKTDAISTEQPISTMDFTFLDVNNTYNPENPSSLYAYVEERQPVKFELGYELDTGEIEWVPCANNYSTGSIDFRSNGSIPSVTLKTESTLYYLDEVYTKSVWNPTGVTLYNMAQTMLNDFQIAYDLDEYLNETISFTPLPVDTVKNLLQLIANAGRCTLNIGRDGQIQIKRTFSVQPLYDSSDSLITDVNDETVFVTETNGASDFSLTNQNSYNIPQVKKLPPVRNVVSTFRTYVVGSTVEQLAESDIVGASNTEYFIRHDLATQVSLSVSGSLSIVGSPIYNAYGCRVVLTGTGKATLNGKKITSTENAYLLNFNVNGVDCNVSNPLITDSNSVKDYTKWIGDYLSLQNTYLVENRGFPELDTMDKIFLQTFYSPNLQTIVIENNLTYNGAIKANTKLVIAE